MTAALRIGILGTARVVPYALLAPAARTRTVSVDAIASRSPARAAAFAARHGIPVARGSYTAVLDDAALDAVYVALPPALHCLWTRRALEAGKHVLCEKPLAVNAECAESVAAAARNGRRALHEGMHMLHLEALRRQRDIVASGTLGRIRRISSTFRHPSIPMPDDDFRLQFALGGGAALDLGCYAVACLRYVAGEEPEVRTVEYAGAVSRVDRWMRAEVALASGATGVVECGFRGAYPRLFSVEVDCEGGSVSWTPGGLVTSRDGTVTHMAIPPTPTYERQLDAFVRQIADGQFDLGPSYDPVANARVVDAMYERAGLGRRVPLVEA